MSDDKLRATLQKDGDKGGGSDPSGSPASAAFNARLRELMGAGAAPQPAPAPPQVAAPPVAAPTKVAAPSVAAPTPITRMPAPAHEARLDPRLGKLLGQIRMTEQEEEQAQKNLAARHLKAFEAEDVEQRQAGAREKAEQRTATDSFETAQSHQKTKVKLYEADILAAVNQARAALSPADRPNHPVVNDCMLRPVSADDISIAEATVADHLRVVRATFADGSFTSYKPRTLEERMLIALVAGSAVLLSSYVLLGVIGLQSLFVAFVLGVIGGGGAFVVSGGTQPNTEYRQKYQQLIANANVALGAWESWQKQVTAEQQARGKALAAEQQARSAALMAKQQARSKGLAAGQAWETAALKAQFRERFKTLQPVLHEYVQSANAASPAWSDPVWQAFEQKKWTPPVELPSAVRLGGLPVRLDGQATIAPVLAQFPGGVSLMIETSGAQKAPALQAVQGVMARLLATVPPGKLRFTFIDPVGLGQNVASFMPLGDHDDALVTVRAWTEPQHIEQRLADLSEHMETVIQKYLRNRYASMEEYNRDAEMVAEPYRILVVANFPVNFTDTAAKRLVSIATNGPRCGVYTLITVDTQQKLPHGFNLADLERVSTVIKFNDGQYRLMDDDLGQDALQLFAPPPDALLNEIVEKVGAAAKAASVVQVPFSRIAPARAKWWSQETTDGIVIPVGVFGANKPQLLELGKGTAQHVLIAGRTGSGKSTLLHVLINSLAMNYSPDELELYLIDFKEGVEFKTYATSHLPHARVIAIETEREFGMSVLQKLDAEISSRGVLFRTAAGDLGEIQNIAAYRRKSGKTLPRIVLIVDEFQEFFAVDDALSGQAAQILDRLVRQGRSFGIHVVLGSQTLAGAYTLNRSTMDQMGVRIALQCSEADSRLILSDDNPAARLLARPGEAIYNDANGMMEGNSPFQTVWLSDEERERVLAALPPSGEARSQIVFEGRELAALAKNALLQERLEDQDRPTTPAAVPAWLGDPIAIKPPAPMLFRRQAGSNLLIVGQDEAAALGIETAAILSLAAHSPAGADGVRFVVLDLSLADSPQAGYLASLLERLPHETELVGRRGIPQAVEGLAAEVAQRMDAEDGSGAPVFLIIHGLMRARDLRPSDDFGSSRGYSLDGFGEAPERRASPAELFARIERDGPEVGVHTIIWCDTYSNLQRSVERATLREFDARVAFQMSTEDSHNLIDSDGASKLGHNRAYFFSEERGQLEKFRPYGIPEAAWLDQTVDLLQRRAGSEAARGML